MMSTTRPRGASIAGTTVNTSIPSAAARTRPRSSSVASLGRVPTYSAALDIAIDAYATRVIQRNSPPESMVDTSLGPYITAVLRRANMDNEHEIQNIPEYESLLELLQDQCNMPSKTAKATLETIARAICTHIIPDDTLYGSFQSFQSLGDALKEAAAEAQILGYNKINIVNGIMTTPPGKGAIQRDVAFAAGIMTTPNSRHTGKTITTGGGHDSPSQIPLSPMAVTSTPSSHQSMGCLDVGITTINGIIGTAANGTPSVNDNARRTAHELIDRNEVLPSATIRPYTPNPAGGPSPLKPDALIPVDLLGALDDPSPHISRHRSRLDQARAEQEAAFPPLGAVVARASRKAEKASRVKKNGAASASPGMDASANATAGNAANGHNGSGKNNGKALTVIANTSANHLSTPNSQTSTKNSNAEANKDLAAALFKPARPRQNSITESTATAPSPAKSPMAPAPNTAAGSSMSSGLSSSMKMHNDTRTSAQITGSASNGSLSTAGSGISATIGTPADQPSSSFNGERSSSPQHHNYLQHQQMGSAVDMLLTMNHDLCEQAARDVVQLVNGDVNVAQYIINAALHAPPICRHMLHDGCYRSDCAFSHDVEGHTCLFWLRGRCGKGPNCKFKHGFHHKLLEGMKKEMPNNSTPGIRTVPLNSTMSSGGITPTMSLSSASRRIPTTTSSTPPSAFANPYASPLLSSSAPAGGGFSAGYGLPSSANSRRVPPSWQTPPVNNNDAFPTLGAANSQPSPATAKNGGLRSKAGSQKSFSFANIASKGYDRSKKFTNNPNRGDFASSSSSSPAATIRIPQDLWNPHENRDASAFYIADPIERYNTVAATVKRADVIDLHFQSTKTFPVVLSKVLPDKLSRRKEVWIVTGTGHHVGSKTHQKGGGALERAVAGWLEAEGYRYNRGRDRNGLGGALMVKR